MQVKIFILKLKILKKKHNFSIQVDEDYPPILRLGLPISSHCSTFFTIRASPVSDLLLYKRLS